MIALEKIIAQEENQHHGTFEKLNISVRFLHDKH